MPSLLPHPARRPHRLVARVALLMLTLVATTLPVRSARATGTPRRPSVPTTTRKATPARSPMVAITGNSTATVPTNMTGSTSLTVTNTGGEQVTVLMSITTCSGKITNCTVSPAGGNLMPGATLPLTVGFKGSITPGAGSTVEITVGGYGYDCTSPGAHTDLVLGTSYDNVENPTDLGAVTGLATCSRRTTGSR